MRRRMNDACARRLRRRCGSRRRFWLEAKVSAFSGAITKMPVMPYAGSGSLSCRVATRAVTDASPRRHIDTLAGGVSQKSRYRHAVSFHYLSGQVRHMMTLRRWIKRLRNGPHLSSPARLLWRALSMPRRAGRSPRPESTMIGEPPSLMDNSGDAGSFGYCLMQNAALRPRITTQGDIAARHFPRARRAGAPQTDTDIYRLLMPRLGHLRKNIYYRASMAKILVSSRGFYQRLLAARNYHHYAFFEWTTGVTTFAGRWPGYGDVAPLALVTVEITDFADMAAESLHGSIGMDRTRSFRRHDGRPGWAAISARPRGDSLIRYRGAVGAAGMLAHIRHGYFIAASFDDIIVIIMESCAGRWRQRFALIMRLLAGRAPSRRAGDDHY